MLPVPAADGRTERDLRDRCGGSDLPAPLARRAQVDGGAAGRTLAGMLIDVRIGRADYLFGGYQADCRLVGLFLKGRRRKNYRPTRGCDRPACTCALRIVFGPKPDELAAANITSRLRLVPPAP